MEQPTELLKQELLNRARDRCECTRSGCPDHKRGVRCPNELHSVWKPEGEDWRIHLITPGIMGGKYTKSNCKLLCIRCCPEGDSYRDRS